jgi:protein TonB
MLQELLESKAKRQRTGWGTAASAVLHGGVIALSVAATMREVNAARPDETEPPPIYIPAPAPAAPTPTTARTSTSAPNPSLPPVAPPLPSFILTDIPTTIPPAGSAIDEDALRKWNDGARRVGETVAGGGAGVSAVVTDGIYHLHMVDKAVVSAANNPSPRYPEMLRQAGVGGTVLAQFVVDTLGRVDMGSFRVLSADHELFADAVRITLPRMRFLPAQVGERKVAQLVQMPFAFSITAK